MSNFPYPGLNLGLSFFVTIPTIHLRKTLRDPNLSLSSSNFLYFIVPSTVCTHFSYYFLLFISLYFLLIISLYFLYFHFSFPFFSYFFFLSSSSTFARRTPLLVGFTSTTPFFLSHISFHFLYFQTSFHVVLFFFFYLFLILSFSLHLHGKPPLPLIHFCHCRPSMTWFPLSVSPHCHRNHRLHITTSLHSSLLSHCLHLSMGPP